MNRRRGVRRAPQEVLERRYRRLLAWYPAGYRAAHADEMLGVALAGAGPGQRRPGPGEAASLVAGGARMRFGVLLAGLRAPGWRDAATVAGFIGAVLLAAIYAESLVGRLASGPFSGQAYGVPALARLALFGGDWRADVVLASGWSLARVALAWRWRWAAAALASLGAVAQAAEVAVRYAGNPSFVVTSWWQVMLALTTALAAVTLLAGPREGRLPLRRAVIVALTAVAAVLAAVPAIESAFTTVTKLGRGASMMSDPLSGVVGPLRDGLITGLAATLLVMIVQLDPAVRRRVLVLSVPVGAAAALTALGLAGHLAPSGPFGNPAALTAPQWAALGAAPLLGFAAGVAWLGRRERDLRLAAAGPPAAGVPAARPQDAGPQDAGLQDAGPQDAGPGDAGPEDAGPSGD